MAWTTPRTWVTSEVVTASHMNTHVRDNLLETAPAAASTSGRFIITDGNNSIDERAITGDNVATSQTTTSTSYTDLTTSGPAVTVTTGTRALVFITAEIQNNTAGEDTYMAYAVSGSTTSSASDIDSLRAESGAAAETYQMTRVVLDTGLTAGSNTFTAKYRVSAGTGTWRRRFIQVLGL